MSPSKFSEWKKVYGCPRLIRKIPRSHWLLPQEKDSIVSFKREHPTIGYRALTWMMVDRDVAYVSPSSVLRTLTEAGLNNIWTRPAVGANRNGFEQPKYIHEQWHTDISYVNYRGTFLFLIAVLEAASRAVLAWDIREKMETLDVDIVLRRAHEKWINGTDLTPRLITDNGSQFIAKDYKMTLRQLGIKHTRTSPGHPQSNGKIERFHGTAKQEMLRTLPKISREQVLRDFGVWIEYYNSERLHSAIGYVAPFDVLFDRREIIVAERERKIKIAKEKRALDAREINNLENRIQGVA